MGRQDPKGSNAKDRPQSNSDIQMVLRHEAIAETKGEEGLPGGASQLPALHTPACQL